MCGFSSSTAVSSSPVLCIAVGYEIGGRGDDGDCDDACPEECWTEDPDDKYGSGGIGGIGGRGS